MAILQNFIFKEYVLGKAEIRTWSKNTKGHSFLLQLYIRIANLRISVGVVILSLNYQD